MKSYVFATFLLDWSESEAREPACIYITFVILQSLI